MPKPRKSRKELELSGATRRNPGRYAAKADGPQFNGTLGDPPDGLKDAEKAAWYELSAMVPERLLWMSDRWLVEVACGLMVKLRRNGIGGENGVKASEIALLTKCLGSMGLTPLDRAKIDLAAEPDESHNPFAEIAKDQKRIN